MAAQVFPLFSTRRPKSIDWSQKELAEFYRVESALIQAGMLIEAERGITDEGDPWFVFCRAEDGEVVVHFARIDGRYVISSNAFPESATGQDFSEMVKELISQHPLVHPRRGAERSNVFLHPTALLVAIVATAFFKSSEASAHNADADVAADTRKSWFGSTIVDGGFASVFVPVEARQVAMVISAVMFATSIESDQNQPDAHSISSFANALDAADSDLAHFPSHNAGLVDARLESVDQENSAELGPTGPQHQLGGQEVLKLLSVVAVLNDLTSPSSESLHASSFYRALTSTPDAGEVNLEHPVLQITIEIAHKGEQYPSVTTVASSGGEKLPSDHVVQSLPQVLQPFLNESIHLSVSQSSEGVLLSLNIPPHLVEVNLTAQTSIQTATGHDPSLVTNDVVPSFGHDISDLASGERSALVEFLQKFMDHTPDYKTIVTDHNVIFYDPHAISTGDLTLKSMTWDFADRISISLVAPSSNFPPELFVTHA